VPARTSPSTTRHSRIWGIFKPTPVLPFATKGTLGLGPSDEALDDGSVPVSFCSCLRREPPAGLNLNRRRYDPPFAMWSSFEVLES